MSTLTLDVDTLMEERRLLDPKQARTFVCRTFTVPASAEALRICLAFAPARSHGYKNLLTISLFDVQGFRGAGHRHAPEQEIVLGRQGATPGFLPGPISPGEWTLEIDCHCVLPSPAGGVEYSLLVESVSSGSVWEVPAAAYLAVGKETAAAPVEGTGGQTAIAEYEPAPHGSGTSRGGAIAVGAERRAPLRAVAAADSRRRWLKGDLHFHTQHSDGRWTVDDVVRYVEQFGLDYVATTDHNTTSAYEDVRWALERAGLPAVVIPAMELTTYWGHANALGVAEWIDWRVRGPEGRPHTIGEGLGATPTGTMERAADYVHERDGLFVVNHPRSNGYPACTGCRWELGDATAGYADVVEVWNGPWDRAQNHQGLTLWDRWLNAGHRLPATAGTDSHEWPRYPAQMGYTYVWARPEVGDILRAVRIGHSFLSNGPALTWSEQAVSDGLAVQLEGCGAHAELRLVHNGETLRRERIGGDGRFSASTDGDPSGWVRAELWQPDSTMLLAMTNPMWLGAPA